MARINTNEQTSVREDRRVRRTKRLLADALMKLMKEKPIRSITVRELAELADVNRGTFYLYYRDIYDLLGTIEDDLCDDFTRVVIENYDIFKDNFSENYITAVLSAIKKNKDTCAALLSENGDIVFLERLNVMVKEKLFEYWKNRNPSAERSNEFFYRYELFSSGFLGVIKMWLSRDCEESIDKLVRIIGDMLFRGLMFGLDLVDDRS